jgi:hypothetical protein
MRIWGRRIGAAHEDLGQADRSGRMQASRTRPDLD